MKSSSEEFLLDLAVAAGITYLFTKTELYWKIVNGIADRLDGVNFTKMAKR